MQTQDTTGSGPKFEKAIEDVVVSLKAAESKLAQKKGLQALTEIRVAEHRLKTAETMSSTPEHHATLKPLRERTVVLRSRVSLVHRIIGAILQL